jgi:hypothetical protein
MKNNDKIRNAFPSYLKQDIEVVLDYLKEERLLTYFQ